MTTISFQIPDRTPKNLVEPIREHLNIIIRSISSVKPARRVQEISKDAISNKSQVILAIGKNAAIYTRELIKIMPHPPLRTFVLQAKGYTDIESPENWDYWDVDHPIPSEINFTASNSVLEELDKIDSETIMHVIVTGGGSSCFAIPEFEIGENYYIEIVKTAQAFGFSIGILNYIRSLIDRVKGGKLSAKLVTNTIYTWCVSDVISDDPAIIGSGPTVAGIHESISTLIDDWLQQIFPSERLFLINKLKTRLKQANEINLSLTRKNFVSVIAKRQDLIDSIETRLGNTRFTPILSNLSLQGDIKHVAEEMLETILKYIDQPLTTIIWSGEPEVSLSVSSMIEGKGGRIAALFSILSEKIGYLDNIIILGLATDGVDGSSPSSGYFITSETGNRLRPLGGALKIISSGNSGKILTSLGYGIELSNTDINMMDIYMAIII